MTLPDGRHARQLLAARDPRSDRPKPKTPDEREPGVTPSPEDDHYVPYESRARVVPRRGVPAARLPRRRVAHGRQRHRRRSAQGRRDGALSVWRVDGRAAGDVALLESPGYAAPAPSPKSSATTAGCSSAGPTTTAWTPATSRDETTLTAAGDLPLALETRRDAGIPYVYSLEGDVEDVSRQHIANRASLVGASGAVVRRLRRPSYFLEQKAGLKTEIVAVGIDGTSAPACPST